MNRLDKNVLEYYIKLRDKFKQSEEYADLYGSPEYTLTPAETKMLFKMVEILLPNDQREDEVNKDSPAKDLMMELLDEVEEDDSSD